jgi:ABC-type nitrate/sulfonate/bicarbonate transport system substrate-binding protein
VLSLLAGSLAQAQNRPRETIHIGIIDRTFFFQPVLVAIQNGFFADEGLNANMRFIRSGEGQAEGLLKGDLHFALSSTEGILQNAERGGPLRMLAANSGRLSHYIVTRRNFRRSRARAQQWASSPSRQLLQLARDRPKHGLKYPDDYKVMGPRRGCHGLLLEGKIDVGLQSIPWVYVGEDAGLNNLGAANDYVGEWQFTAYNVNSDWAKANRARPRLPARAPAYRMDLPQQADVGGDCGARDEHQDPPLSAPGTITQAPVRSRASCLQTDGLRKVFDTQIRPGCRPRAHSICRTMW